MRRRSRVLLHYSRHAQTPGTVTDSSAFTLDRPTVLKPGFGVESEDKSEIDLVGIDEFKLA